MFVVVPGSWEADDWRSAFSMGDGRYEEFEGALQTTIQWCYNRLTFPHVMNDPTEFARVTFLKSEMERLSRNLQRKENEPEVFVAWGVEIRIKVTPPAA
jgi:hypothetical protein